MIVGRPGALRVQARARLHSPIVAERLLQALRNILFQHSETGHMVGVSDLDVSENPLSVHHWKMLFEVFASTGVRIERMRFFGCPTMDDEVVGILADYLEHLGFESLPLELHLSHCNITTKGFCRLVDSIKANPAFPYIHPRTEQPLPLYLRLEKNYIDQAAIISYMETR